MKSFGLTEHGRNLICGVFAKHTEIVGAKIFGSRAKGTFRTNSDIDLTLEGEISSRLLAEISEELDELPLPYLFDVTAYDAVKHASLKKHIDRVGQIFYERKEALAEK